ncbi:MAG: ribonuclease R [Candidatus Zixiibacteriota bacterium]|nr:MAG: ribonuclease R [candidate division Zixibacteria bacterium]
MKQNSRQIIDFIRQKSSHPMKIKELAKALSVSSGEYAAFRKTIKSLLASGELVRLKRGRIGVASEMDILVGKISVTRAGTGFLIVEGQDEDLFIPGVRLHTALDGDTVMVRLAGEVDGRKAGTVIRIMERTRRNIVGVFHKSRHFAFVTPDNKKIHRDIYIAADETRGAKEGEKVVAVLTRWDDPHLNPEGKITERIGFPGQPGVDMLTIIKGYDLPESFSDEVLSQAETASAMLTDDEIGRRRDLTRQCVYTIDPSDAKDHDDAISVEETDEGFRLSVHIADVSHFVEEGAALDKEALQRGNSVYLPGMVIPMLPEILSNDVCSLKPNRRRLAHSVFIDFDSKGKALRWHLADTLIRSRAKLSYEEVQEFFDSGQATPRIKKVADNLLLARKLARLLTRRRFADGSLDFDLPESKIILNKKGEVIELGHKVRLESHRLVEEFMLAANKAVALTVFRLGQQFIYRVHDKPDMEKLTAFSALMERMGYSFPASPHMKPIAFARFLEKVKDVPEEDFINELMLRSMKKAVYQRQNIGHFGLAFNHYTHFTSPIRRYPDLLVHRLVRKLKGGKYPVKFARRAPAIIDHAGKHCSETERIAESAERDAVKVKQMQYMRRHVGDHFDGIISGVTPYGFFVRLDNVGVEGMVRVSTIDDDYYHFDEKRYRMVGRRSGRVYQLGRAVRVGVLRVDAVAGEMDLFLVRPPETAPKKAGRKDTKAAKRKGKKRNKKR